MDEIMLKDHKNQLPAKKNIKASTGKTKLRFFPQKNAKKLVTATLIGITLAGIVPPTYSYARDSFITSEKKNLESAYMDELKSLSAWSPGSNKEVKQLTSKLTKGIGYNPLNHVVATTHYLTPEGKLQSNYSKTDEISQSTVKELAEQKVGLYGEVRSFKGPDDWKDSGQLIHNLINDEKKEKQFISDMKKFIKDKKLSGFSIDFESVWTDDREKFVEFLKKVKSGLGRSVKLAVCVPVQFNNNMNCGYDYNGIAKYCDEVKIMNYQIDKGQLTADEKNIWKHISSVVKSKRDAKKFSDGLPLFAELNGETGVRYYYSYSIENVIKNNEIAKVSRDKSGDMHFAYYNSDLGQTQVSVMDSNAVKEKMSMLKGMNGVCLYDLSYAADSSGKLADVVVNTVKIVEDYNKQIISKKKEEYKNKHPFKTVVKNIMEVEGVGATTKVLLEGLGVSVIEGASKGKDVIDLFR